MKIILDPRLSVEQNAALYFERAKKAKRKLEGAKKAVADARTKQAVLDAPKPEPKAPPRKAEWYERFRWFFSSDGFLCVAGKDATTNEMVIKQHARAGDIVFHTDMAGSPFVVIKGDGKEIPQLTLDEAAAFTAAYSRAWKQGLSNIEVFHVNPDQVTKTANPGEHLPKGAFMIRGHTIYHQPAMDFCVGKMADGRVMAGPESAVKARCALAYRVLQGNQNIMKELAKLLSVHPDLVMNVLPQGVKMGGKIESR